MVWNFKNGIAIKDKEVCSCRGLGRNKENEKSGLGDFQLEKMSCLSEVPSRQLYVGIWSVNAWTGPLRCCVAGR